MSTVTTLCNKTLLINSIEFKNKKCIIKCTTNHNLIGIVPVSIFNSTIPDINGLNDFEVISNLGDSTILQSVNIFSGIIRDVSIDITGLTANINNLNYTIKEKLSGVNKPVAIGNTSVFDGAKIQISNKVGKIISDDPKNIITGIMSDQYDFFADFQITLKVQNGTANTNIIIYIG